jgi:SpoVK/Ycf46/Vps4 family AAA+-type ATPase
MTRRYGSFYGRDAAQKYVSMGDDFEKIAKARQDMTDLARKEKARKDSTVTILETGDQVAGLGKYREWLEDRKSAVENPDRAREDGKEPVRGVLMTGLPGTGKTQGAKYTAYRLGLSLVQFRIDNLLGGLVGDSEKNFKRYRKRVEMLAPCVVLIDEIEKLFADERGGSGGSSEVKMNIFTALLDWMQENKKGIFFYATCNSVKNLPSELLRDGRFSMRFSVFMPTYQELTEIICFYMKKVNDLSGGRVFENAAGIVSKRGEISDEAAKLFLHKVTLSGRESHRNMFFTGANIEALIKDVQYNVPGEIGSINQYVEAMLKSAQGEFCQPYGETNLKGAVNFWIDALENNFTDAAGYGGNESGKRSESQRRQAPLSFQRFDRQKGVFGNEALSFDNEYDKYLYEVFSQKIQ